MKKEDKSDIKILIVDDIKSARKVLRILLGQLGFRNVTECAECEEALDELQRSEFDLVLSDLNLQSCTGLSLLDNMRSMDNNKDTPFILITSEDKKAHSVDLSAQELSGFLYKPFDSSQLMDKIDSALYVYYEEEV